MRIKLIVVGPKYQLNLGYIARVAKNFGIERLFLVNPRVNVRGNRAIMYAKHARELLETAKVYRSFDDSIKDCEIVMGTTGVWEKARSNFKQVYLIEEAMKRLEKRKTRKEDVLGLVIGRDDTGLSVDELEKCDIVAYIGTNPEYPVLNISHALAIMLFVLTRTKLSGSREGMKRQNPDRKELEYLYSTFGSMMKGKRIRNRKAVMNVFKRLITSSQPNKQELHALITALK